jgi:hypothetical protein
MLGNREQLDAEVEAEVHLHFRKQTKPGHAQPVPAAAGATPRATPLQQQARAPGSWLVPGDFSAQRTTKEGMVRKRSTHGGKPTLMQGWQVRRLVLEHDDHIAEPVMRYYGPDKGGALGVINLPGSEVERVDGLVGKRCASPAPRPSAPHAPLRCPPHRSFRSPVAPPATASAWAAAPT